MFIESMAIQLFKTTFFGKTQYFFNFFFKKCKNNNGKSCSILFYSNKSANKLLFWSIQIKNDTIGDKGGKRAFWL